MIGVNVSVERVLQPQAKIGNDLEVAFNRFYDWIEQKRLTSVSRSEQVSVG